MTDKEKLTTLLGDLGLDFSEETAFFEGDKLVRLNLSHNNLEILPSTLFELESLQDLDLSNNALIEIPERISQLTQLRILRLKENKLNELPLSFFRLHNLERLDLSENFLTTLPGEIELLSQLRHLDIHANRVENLPESMSNMERLQYLGLHNNLLQTLPIKIEMMPQLHTLDLSQNLFSRLTLVLDPGNTLKEIYLHDNQLTSLNLVSEDYAGLPLNYLAIMENRLSTLPSGLLQMKNLEEILFYDNPLTMKSVEIIEFLSQLIRNNSGYGIFQSFSSYFVDNEDWTSTIAVWKLSNLSSFTEEQLAEVYNTIGYSYSELGNYNEAFARYSKGIEIYLRLTEGKEITSNGMSDIFLSMGHLYESMGDTYRKNRKFKMAIQHLEKADDIFRSIEENNPGSTTIHLATISYELAKYYFDTKTKETAVSYLIKAAELYTLSEFPMDVNKVLDKLYDLDPEKAFRAAGFGPYNQYWLVGRVTEMMKNFQPIPGKYWGALHRSIADFWSEIREKLLAREYRESEYYKSWKLRFLTEKSITRTTNYSLINLIAGANNIESDIEHQYKNLRDEQQDVPPLWFLEFPVLLHHDERYVKIRLNNMVSSYDGANLHYMPFPTNTRTPNPPLKRMKIKIDMPWQESYEFDHIFEPNSEREYESSQKNPHGTWLTDVYSIDVGDHPQSKDNITINYIVKLFFEDERKEDGDVVTTSKSYTLPVVRKNRYQVIQKYRNQHANALAVILVVWSIMSTAFGYVLQATEYIQNNAGGYDPGLLTIGFMGGIILTGILAIVFTFKRINKEILEDRVYLVKEQL